MSVPDYESRSIPETDCTIKDIGNGTLVYEAKVDNLTTKKFWSLMWADNEFWNNTVTDLNMRLVTYSIVEQFGLRHSSENFHNLWNSKRPIIAYDMVVTMQSDFVVENIDEKNRIVTAKLKMLNFPIPEWLNFPKSCDQTTEIVVVEQTSNYIKVRTTTEAKNFPLTESFKIHQV